MDGLKSLPQVEGIPVEPIRVGHNQFAVVKEKSRDNLCRSSSPPIHGKSGLFVEAFF
jgi:hypothetical protein